MQAGRLTRTEFWRQAYHAWNIHLPAALPPTMVILSVIQGYDPEEVLNTIIEKQGVQFNTYHSHYRWRQWLIKQGKTNQLYFNRRYDTE